MQTNSLGPFALARLLEPELVAGAPSRIVNVSSIMHRFARLKSADSYLHDFKTGGSYKASKLANVLFAYEHHRRMAKHAVQVLKSADSLLRHLWACITNALHLLHYVRLFSKAAQLACQIQ